MNQHTKLQTAVSRIAFGYLFLFLNVNLGSIDIIPTWAGYLLIGMALPALAQEEAEFHLLKPLAELLGLWALFQWLAIALGMGWDLTIGGVLAIPITLCFHFQLLTNLARIAEAFECPEQQRLLRLRSVNTVMQTLTAFVYPWRLLQSASAVISLLVVICTGYVLLSFRRSLAAALPE